MRLAALSRQGPYATEELLVALYVEDWRAVCAPYSANPAVGVAVLEALVA